MGIRLYKLREKYIEEYKLWEEQVGTINIG